MDWLEAWARRDAPAKAGSESLARLKDGWREPLVEELSKETYNAMTELQAVLESQAWDDAARLVTSFDPEAAPGGGSDFQEMAASDGDGAHAAPCFAINSAALWMAARTRL